MYQTKAFLEKEGLISPQYDYKGEYFVATHPNGASFIFFPTVSKEIQDIFFAVYSGDGIHLKQEGGIFSFTYEGNASLGGLIQALLKDIKSLGYTRIELNYHHRQVLNFIVERDSATREALYAKFPLNKWDLLEVIQDLIERKRLVIPQLVDHVNQFSGEKKTLTKLLPTRKAIALYKLIEENERVTLPSIDN